MPEVGAYIESLVTAFGAATEALNVDVVDSWTAANASPNVLTVGVPDRGFLDLGALTRPAWDVDDGPSEGWGEAPQLRQVTIHCQLDVPAVSDNPNPTDVRDVYHEIIATCRASLDARTLGAQRTWMAERQGYQADGDAGWTLFATFDVILVDILQ